MGSFPLFPRPNRSGAVHGMAVRGPGGFGEPHDPAAAFPRGGGGSRRLGGSCPASFGAAADWAGAIPGWKLVFRAVCH